MTTRSTLCASTASMSRRSMAARWRPCTARMTGAWNTFPAKPKPTSPTLSIARDCTWQAQDRQGRLGSVQFILAALIVAAQSDSTPAASIPRRPLMAVTQTVLLNVTVNRLDAWAFAHNWAKSGTRTWWRNLSVGWDWDEDQFGTNLMMHPYHGGLYFNTARDNGLSFWEAVPVAVL